MDPLSITRGCLSILSAISTATHLVIDFIVSCREARDEITAVSRELSAGHGPSYSEAEANELKQLPEGSPIHLRYHGELHHHPD